MHFLQRYNTPIGEGDFFDSAGLIIHFDLRLGFNISNFVDGFIFSLTAR